MSKKVSKAVIKNIIRRLSSGSAYSILLNMNDFKTKKDIDIIKQNFTNLYKNTQLSAVFTYITQFEHPSAKHSNTLKLKYSLL